MLFQQSLNTVISTFMRIYPSKGRAKARVVNKLIQQSNLNKCCAKSGSETDNMHYYNLFVHFYFIKTVHSYFIIFN